MKKFNNIKLEGIQLQEEGAPLTVQELHHNGVKPMSNLRTTPKAIFCSFMQFKARKT